MNNENPATVEKKKIIKENKDGERKKLFITCMMPVAKDPAGCKILIS